MSDYRITSLKRAKALSSKEPSPDKEELKESIRDEIYH